MTSQGSPLIRLRRALETGNPLLVEAAARELPRLELAEALAVSLTFLAAGDADRYRRAAVRWHGRYTLEVRPSPAEAELALAALLALAATGPEAPASAHALASLFESRGLTREEHAIDGYARRWE